MLRGSRAWKHRRADGARQLGARQSVGLSAGWYKHLFDRVNQTCGDSAAGHAEARHPALRRISLKTPDGAVRLAAPPPVFDEAGARELGTVPGSGEHAASIWAEFAA